MRIRNCFSANRLLINLALISLYVEAIGYPLLAIILSKHFEIQRYISNQTDHIPESHELIFTVEKWMFSKGVYCFGILICMLSIASVLLYILSCKRNDSSYINLTILWAYAIKSAIIMIGSPFVAMVILDNNFGLICLYILNIAYTMGGIIVLIIRSVQIIHRNR